MLAVLCHTHTYLGVEKKCASLNKHIACPFCIGTVPISTSYASIFIVKTKKKSVNVNTEAEVKVEDVAVDLSVQLNPPFFSKSIRGLLICLYGPLVVPY